MGQIHKSSGYLKQAIEMFETSLEIKDRYNMNGLD